MKFLKRLIFKLYHLIFFLGAFFLFFPFVNAEVPTGEQYSEFATHKVVLMDILTAYTNFQLYGYDFAGHSPSLSSFMTGTTSLVRYYNNTDDHYSNWAIRMYNSYRSAGTYSLSWRVTFNNSSNAGTFCSKIGKPFIAGGSTNSYNCAVSGNTSYVLINYNLNSADTGTSYVDFPNVGGGLSANWFLRLATAVYYPQITVSDRFDTSGLENQNQIIINQNQTTINQNQQIIDEQNKTNQKIDSIDDTLNDSSVDSSDDTINKLKDKIPTNSVISDLILLPVKFLQNFVNALGSSCTKFSLGNLYGTDLFMPCINLETYLGTGIWTTIDLIFSGLFVYSLRKKFIQIYENLTNLTNGGNEVD